VCLQDAFETLSDQQKRREYDSVDDFDDSLPSTCRPADFFAVFGSAFRRQSRWSMKTPVPDLGDADEGYENVQAFYDFWFSFKSWREFPHEDEEDPEVLLLVFACVVSIHSP
jgi:DnaJ homolog subfamily C member 2